MTKISESVALVLCKYQYPVWASIRGTKGWSDQILTVPIIRITAQVVQVPYQPEHWYRFGCTHKCTASKKRVQQFWVPTTRVTRKRVHMLLRAKVPVYVKNNQYDFVRIEKLSGPFVQLSDSGQIVDVSVRGESPFFIGKPEP